MHNGTLSNLLLIDRMLDQNKLSVSDLDELIPGYFHINRKDNLALLRMGRTGCEYFGRSETELLEMGIGFLENYVHPESQCIEHSKLQYFAQQCDHAQVFAYFERVRRDEDQRNYEWFLSTAKLSTQCDGILMVSYPVKYIDQFAHKLTSLLDENQFMREHYQQFASLTNRELAIVKCIVRGEPRRSIAEQLSISVHTLDTHRKNIRRKLSINSIQELMKYAEAFGLLEP